MALAFGVVVDVRAAIAAFHADIAVEHLELIGWSAALHAGLDDIPTLAVSSSCDASGVGGG